MKSKVLHLKSTVSKSNHHNAITESLLEVNDILYEIYYVILLYAILFHASFPQLISYWHKYLYINNKNLLNKYHVFYIVYIFM